MSDVALTSSVFMSACSLASEHGIPGPICLFPNDPELMYVPEETLGQDAPGQAVHN